MKNLAWLNEENRATNQSILSYIVIHSDLSYIVKGGSLSPFLNSLLTPDAPEE